MRYSELRRQIEAVGCYIVRNGANHDIYYSPITELKFPVGRHMSEDVPKGTERSILRKAGLL